MTVRFLDYGPIVTAIEVPDRHGRIANVALGFAGLADYEAKNRDYYFGALAGRYAGRIGGARFTLEGREYRLEANDGPNTLHGGRGRGLDDRIWSVEHLSDGSGAVLRTVSPAGEQGMPGTLSIFAGRRGYNHSWAIDAPGTLRLAARLADPGSGRTLEVLTTEPSIHVYTANWFPGTDRGAAGTIYRPHDAVALETGHFADSPNRPELPSTLLRPGETFRSTTIYRFGVD